MQIKSIKIKKSDELNIIIGQAHFIKTVEDIHELMVTSIPKAEFGLAFCEASGATLIRTSGTRKDLIEIAEKNALKVKAGHCFFLVLGNCYPINVLPRLKQIPEVVSLYCATANQTELIVAESKNGRAILGVIDGVSPKRTEKESERQERIKFLRNIGYKLG